MSGPEVLIAIFTGLAVNEFCDVSPWAARKLIRWSARHRYDDPARAGIRAEELASLIDERPGKLLKLITALGFVAMAITTETRKAVMHRIPKKVIQAWRNFRKEVTGRPATYGDMLVSWCILPSFVYPLLLLPGKAKSLAPASLLIWMIRARLKHVIAQRHGRPEAGWHASALDIVVCLYFVVPVLTLAAGYDVVADIRAFVSGDASAAAWFGLIFSIVLTPHPWMTMHLVKSRRRAEAAGLSPAPRSNP
jgi:hypothetical protein